MGRFRFNRALVLATTAATVVVIGAITAAAWLAGGEFGLGGEVEVRYVQGPAGPAGPAGPRGERGATGAQGVQGAAGAAGQTIVVEKEKPVVQEKVVTVEKIVEKTVEVPAYSRAPAPTRQASARGAAGAQGAAAARGPAPTLVARSPAGQPGATTFQDTARQPLTATREDAVSTFSLDTDRTSFQLALNWARAGHRVDPASVRAEEWVNAFAYGYAAPRTGDRFAITSELFVHPLDSGKYMARVAFQAPDVVTTAPLNVTLVLDASGSMADGNRVAIARAAAEAIRQSLDRDDRMAVVHFTTDVLAHLTVEAARPDDRAVADSIAQLAPHRSTNVQAGLNLGVQLADRLRRERPQALNYVILMSDGVANVDATDPFAILEATAAPSGSNPLRLITVGVGIANYNDLLLEQLAQHGNGWYRYLFDVAQARATFQRENWLALSSPIADQTRAQVVWNPAAVRTWRIVGYENRVTSAAAFTQDRAEFAEVYAGAATTVFYELELHDDFRDQGGLGQVELRWVGPESGRAWSQSSDLVSNGEVVQLQDHPLLAFGAVVALTADRYSTLRDGSQPDRGIARDLWSLREQTVELQNDLGQLAAFKDFAYVLETLLMNVPRVAPDTSGPKRSDTIQRANLDGSQVEDLVTGLSVPVGLALDVPAGKLYWGDGDTHTIQRANLDGSQVEDLVTDLDHPAGLVLDVRAGKLYWTDRDRGKIQRANLDGSQVEDLVTGLGYPRGLSAPDGLALDVRAGKLYWSDQDRGKIQRANLDGSQVEDLVTGLSVPAGVALDVPAGKLYWSDWDRGKIQRANLDGSQVEDLVTGLVNPTHLVLDIAAFRLYWSDWKADKIQRANLDGSQVEDLVTGLAQPHGLALDVAAGKLYWSDWGAHKIQRTNLDGS